MKLIVGLGNPGIVYRSNRHNIGMRIAGTLAKEHRIRLSRDKSVLYKEGRGKIGGINVVVAHPLVFMNLSGQSVRALVIKYRVRLEDLLVVCDDLDLNAGSIRIRPAGSHAGHKGLKSIIEHLGSDSFPRLRVGIGRPAAKKDVSDFVLSGFTAQQRGLMREAAQRAGECLRVWLREGIKQAMNQFNRKRQDDEKL
jgi:PTH1 family peptidyl-tRNA hydrolase